MLKCLYNLVNLYSLYLSFFILIAEVLISHPNWISKNLIIIQFQFSCILCHFSLFYTHFSFILPIAQHSIFLLLFFRSIKYVFLAHPVFRINVKVTNDFHYSTILQFNKVIFCNKKISIVGASIPRSQKWTWTA